MTQFFKILTTSSVHYFPA